MVFTAAVPSNAGVPAVRPVPGDARPDGRLRVGFYTDAPVWGGAEVALATLLAHLDDHVEPVVVGPTAAVVDRLAAARPGSDAVVVSGASARSGPRPRLGLRRVLGGLRLDLLHVNLNRLSACSEAVTAAATLTRLPVVAVAHSTIGAQSRLGTDYSRLAARLCSAYVSVGTATARRVEEMLSMPPGAVRVIPNGVDRPVVPAAPPRADMPDVVVGALARAHPVKALDVLVTAIAQVPGARARLVGAAEDGAALVELAEQLGIGDRVSVEPWCARPADALADFDVLALSSRVEAMPLCVLEAMHAGLPVVATDVGSVSEAVLDGRTGIVVPPGDPAALAAALRRVVDQPALRRRMGREGRDRARRLFSAEAMARGYQSLYAEVAGRRRDRRCGSW